MKRAALVTFALTIFGAMPASASAIDCVDGTVASYLTSSPCQFGTGTVQLTSYSSTFAGISADTSIVQFITRGTSITLDIRPASESGFSQYDSGTGSVSLQLVFDLPVITGSSYQMEFYAVDGCCDLGSLGLSNFPGGLVTESITATTLAVIPEGGPFYSAQEQVDSTYSSASGNGSQHYSGQSSGPFQLLEFSEPALGDATPPAETPEPATIWLSASGLLFVLAASKLPRSTYLR